MKVETSVSDEFYREIQKLAARLGVSNNDLLRQALIAFVGRESREENADSDTVKSALDEIYSQESSEVDSILSKMQWASLPKETW